MTRATEIRQQAPDTDPSRWREHAACKGADTAIFYPASSVAGVKDQYAAAKAYCGRCPVREACLSEALLFERTSGGRHGMYGGLTPDQRAQLVVKR